MTLIACAGLFVGLAGEAGWRAHKGRQQAAERAFYRRNRRLAELKRLANPGEDWQRSRR